MKSRKSIVTRLDKEFSLYIRQRQSVNGTATCFTCGKRDHWRNMDCGHFMSRKHYATRWDEKNCQVQCKYCNIFRHGEQFVFGENLDRVYGEGTSHQLLQESRTVVKLSNPDLVEKIEYYKAMNKTFIE